MSTTQDIRQMTPEQYRSAIKRLGYTQEGFAAAIGAGKRSGQRWASVSVPPAVSTLVALIEARPELREVLTDIAERKARKERA